MKKILILFAHPAFQKSRVNKFLVQNIKNMDGITFHDLYETYPEFDIDIKTEQRLLEEHDVIIFHHPFFWYSVPAILKEWMDLVLTHGWAYGSTGTALQGKWFMNVITTGGPEHVYSGQEDNPHSIRRLLAPIEKSARLCKMIFLPPFTVHGTHAISQDKIDDHVQEYVRLLNDLRTGNIDVQKAAGLEIINNYK